MFIPAALVSFPVLLRGLGTRLASLTSAPEAGDQLVSDPSTMAADGSEGTQTPGTVDHLGIATLVGVWCVRVRVCGL